MRGVIDRCEYHSDGVRVIDYKTGSIEKSAFRLQRPSAVCGDGGGYWRQAVFYKLLLEHSPRRHVVRSVTFDFVEPDASGKPVLLPIDITLPDEETVRQQIRMAWDRIQARDFFTGCGKEGCGWCDFVKAHEIVAEWKVVDPESEEG